MPGIYQGVCTRCGQRTEATDFSIGIYRDDGTVTDLPHPGEIDAMQDHGFTWQQVVREGRLVHSDTVICRDCGSMHLRRQLAWRRKLLDRLLGRQSPAPPAWGQALSATQRCAGCGSENLVSLDRANGGIRCPLCGDRGLALEIYAIS